MAPLCLSKYASLLLSMLAIAIFMLWAEIFMLLLVISLDCFQTKILTKNGASVSGGM
ncbi:uncharacterized protein DS421_11g348720 [Arachis hypogaea]|nr:uncharacterized protein DS421_11g348720 [Arachis hypogaea]